MTSYSAVTPEPETVNAGTNHATAAEKERAERTYKEMITNLENFLQNDHRGRLHVGFWQLRLHPP